MQSSFGETVVSIGSEDFFVAKVFPDNLCGCVYPNPQAELISFSENLLSVSGTVEDTSAVMFWYWGDGDNTEYTQPGSMVTHFYNGDGPYTVCLRAINDCADESDCLNDLLTMNEEFNSGLINVFPNPFNKSIEIQCHKDQSISQLTLCNITGELIIYKSATGTSTTIQTGDLPTGIYLLRILTKDGREFSKKIVKE
jgi:PKD repeat protein